MDDTSTGRRFDLIHPHCGSLSAMKVGLIDILKIGGFDESLSTKLVRHQDHRYPGLRQHDWLELYQSYQSKPRFHSAKQIVSFYGLPGTRAEFYGVYKVLGWRPASEGRTVASCKPSLRWNRESQFFYNLERDTRFDDLRDRLIIDWGAGALAWVQKLSNKAVLEILEPGRKLGPFSDYLEFNLTYAELKDLFSNEEAHRDWKTALSAVAGVYLVLAQGSGDLYVGSASGDEGIWGRWRDYAQSRDGDGGNEKLRALVAEDNRCPGSFRFSVLQILPKSMARDEVLKREARYKDKLGSRATGLNLN
jgi:hypothetical protein